MHFSMAEWTMSIKHVTVTLSEQAIEVDDIPHHITDCQPMQGVSTFHGVQVQELLARKLPHS